MKSDSSPDPQSLEKRIEPRSTLKAALLGSVLFFAALPPLNWHLLAWIAPMPWLLLIRLPSLPGRRPYLSLWLAGTVFWLLAVHWIRLPHPLNYLAWIALAGYLGLYLPAFVLLSRVGVYRWRAPMVLVAPVVWTGLDWLRGHLWTGFLMASLAHTQYRVPLVIQFAEFVGEYGISFLIMFVAANILEVVFGISRCTTFRQLVVRFPGYFVRVMLPIAAAIAFSAIVGARGASLRSESDIKTPRIALIQGNTPADWKMDAARQREIMEEYIRLSREAVAEAQKQDGRGVDLVVWPETSFRQNLISIQPGYTPPAEVIHPSALAVAKTDLKELVTQLGSEVLVGLDRIEVMPGPDGGMAYRMFNSAVFVDNAGEVRASYDKMHCVPFGEYIPFADWFPVLYQLTPLTGGIVPGAAPAAMKLGNEILISPNICYETVVPHLIRHQLLTLEKSGQPVDLLVNLTNDAWFWGSSELDMHLACGVFRAVETRTPLLIAANGGLSAFVDATGKIRDVTARQEPTFLIVEPEIAEWPTTFYTRYGDWFALVCVVCCLVLSGDAILHRKQQIPAKAESLGSRPK